MEVFRNDVKAGLFILVAGILFIYALFRVGGMLEQWQPGFNLNLRFADAQQVEPGAEVYFRGMKVGRVKSISLSQDKQAVNMLCRLDPDFQLYTGTVARVADKSVLGGKMIELLTPAQPQEGSKPQLLVSGSTIEGLPPGGLTATLEMVNQLVVDYRGKLDDLVDKLNRLLDNLNTTATETTAGIQSFAGTKDSLTETLAAYKQLADNLNQEVGHLSKQVDKLLLSTQGTVSGMGQEISDLSTTLKADIASIRSRTNTLLENSNQMVSHTDTIIVENREALTQSIATLQRTLEHLEQFSAKVAERPSSLIWKDRKKKKEP